MFNFTDNTYRILIILTLFAFLGRTFFATLFHVYLWQLKEYRIDRIIDHLKSKKNRKSVFSIFFYIRSFIILIFFFGLEFIENNILSLILLIYVLETGKALIEIKNKTLKRPKLTKKAILISLISFGTGCYFPLIFLYDAIFLYREFTERKLGLLFLMGGTAGTIFITFILPILVFAIVLIFNIITRIIKKYIYYKAKIKIQKNPHLLVIGITGSYGKTSTKEFLYQILSKDYKCLKTEKNINSEIGVAQTILTELNKDHQIFIVEMGAYKKGEIKTTCGIVKPKIGILTAISNQHLALFGSQEKIRQAKMELIDSLPENGLAILNFDNDLIQESLKKVNIPYKTYSLNDKKADIFAENIEETEDNLKFSINLNHKKIKFETNIIPKHNIANIMPSILIADYLGMDLNKLPRKIKDLKPIDKTMNRKIGKKDLIIIDDTYNANPDGVKSALDHLKLYRNKKRVIIMPSMLELGEKSAESHQEIGQKISEICTHAIFLDKDQKSNLEIGIKTIKSNLKIYFENEKLKILDILEKEISYNSVILFESRGAENVMKTLLNREE